jgi:hypothetical protein
LASAREVLACIEVGQAMRYIKPVDSGVVARVNRVIGTLVRVLKQL